MERLCCVTLCLLGLGLLYTNAFEVTVKDDANNTCVYASMEVRFTIEYETTNGSSKSVTYTAPEKVMADGSSCGENPLLSVQFGNGFLWSLNFTKNAEEYRGSVLSFTYNTSDPLFPDAKTKGLVTSTTDSNIFVPIPMTAAYKCLHEDTVTTEHVVQLYWNVTLQAYLVNSTLGRDFHCTADTPTPSPTPHTTTAQSPTTVPSTTTSTTTTTTTTPNTTTTTPKPTSKPLDKPSVGNYFLYNGSETCLMASMGLQLNASLMVDGKNVWNAFNINPNFTASSGNCGNETAFLKLDDNSTNTVVEFYFFVKKNSFHLQEVNVTLHNGSGISQRTNFNLSLWEASLNNAYLCRKEQFITVSEDLHINTFDVKVQPFGIKNGTYGTAEDCVSHQNYTVPIAVGAALGVLVILVLVAYFIGRRNRSSAGYEHF